MTTNDELRRKIAELEELAQVLGSKAEFLRETARGLRSLIDPEGETAL
jgi:hypothetical protein